jgi:hypothetical protein
MNHLRDLLDSLKKEVMAPHNAIISQGVLNRAADWCERLGERAVCFTIGDIATVLDLQVIPELIMLPYSTCWFEAEVHPPSAPNVVLTAGILIQRDENRKCSGLVWSKLMGKWLFIGETSGAECNSTWASGGPADDSTTLVWLMVKAAHAFLSALHCSNVRREEHAPSEKLQRARVKRGKAPLFSHWTLQLDGKNERSADKGGTHASPRVHLVRGHPRQYAPNKWTWVQAYVKGNKAIGVVHKDYSAGPALMNAARPNASAQEPGGALSARSPGAPC